MDKYIKIIGEIIAMASKLQGWRYISLLVTAAVVVFIWKLPELVKAMGGV